MIDTYETLRPKTILVPLVGRNFEWHFKCLKKIVEFNKGEQKKFRA